MTPRRELFLIDGANELRGLRSLIWVVRRWPRLRRELMSTEGYVTHRLWYVPPFTLGLTSWWSDRRGAYRFAHQPAHLEFWSWSARADTTKGGWLATYELVGGGPLWGNGVARMMESFGEFVEPASMEPPKPAPEDRRSERIED
jgi:hypothetical protein